MVQRLRRRSAESGAVPGHGAGEWADALRAALARRDELGRGAVTHARRFSWDRTADALLDTYAVAAAEFADRQAVDAPSPVAAGMIRR